MPIKCRNCGGRGKIETGTWAGETCVVCGGRGEIETNSNALVLQQQLAAATAKVEAAEHARDAANAKLESVEHDRDELRDQVEAYAHTLNLTHKHDVSLLREVNKAIGEIVADNADLKARLAAMKEKWRYRHTYETSEFVHLSREDAAALDDALMTDNFTCPTEADLRKKLEKVRGLWRMLNEQGRPDHDDIVAELHATLEGNHA